MKSLDPENLNHLHTEWLSLQPLKPEHDQRLWKKLRLEWNYHSNHIEGNTLTYGETASLLIHDQAVGDHELRNYIEMKAHDLAIEHVRGMVSDARPLTEGDIRDLNRILLKESFWRPAITDEGQATRIEIIPGEYKQQANNVRTADGGIFRFAAPDEVPARMQQLIEGYREAIAAQTLHPIGIASKFHHDFVLIHPFGDGNGRTARLLVNYILMKAGYPPIIVPSPEKDRYLAALRQADAGDLSPLTNYLGSCTEKALQRGIAAAKGESIEDEGDLDKEISIFVRNQKQNAQPVVSVSRNSIESIVKSSLIPLMESVITKTKTFEPIFESIEITASPSTGTLAKDPLGTLLQFAEKGNPGTIHVTFRFFAYQGETEKPFNLKRMIGLKFEQFEYLVTDNDHLLAKKSYAKSFTENEINQFAKTIQEGIFEEIKKRSQSE